jgi:hypothetical protein
MESKTHEYSRSLGRLLGRAAVVSSLIKRIERMASSTKDAGLFHKLTAKSRPSKNIAVWSASSSERRLRDRENSRALAALANGVNNLAVRDHGTSVVFAGAADHVSSHRDSRQAGIGQSAKNQE